MMRFLIEGLIVRVRAFTQPVSTARRLQAENDRLQDICASAYQLAGLVGAPVRFLDTLSRPLDATPQQISVLLPVGEHEINAVKENKALRNLLKEARDGLHFFKTWGDSLNSVLGYSPPGESWKPTLAVIARIDAALRLPPDLVARFLAPAPPRAIPDDSRFLAFWVLVWGPLVSVLFLVLSPYLAGSGDVVITAAFYAFVYVVFAPALYRLFIQGRRESGRDG